MLSYSDGITDAYVRYHQIGRSGVGFSLYWNHSAEDVHIERIATLISGSLWSSASGAPFTYPFTVQYPNAEATKIPTPIPQPSPVPSQGPQEEEPNTVKSGTGFFVTSDGRVITNAHVVRDCSEIHVGTGQGNYVAAHLVARELAQATLASTPIRRTLSQPESELAPSKRGFSPPPTDAARTASQSNFCLQGRLLHNRVRRATLQPERLSLVPVMDGHLPSFRDGQGKTKWLKV